MQDRIKTAFQDIHAEESLKEKSLNYILEQGQRSAPHHYWRMATAAACLLVLLIGSGWFVLKPTAAISLDINPSLELGINRFDRVVSAKAFTQDGQVLIQNLDLRFENFEDAVQQILEDDHIESLLNQDDIMHVVVIGPDGAQTSRLRTSMEHCEQPNVRCGSAQWAEAEKAHAHGLSCGKYRAYQELQELEPDVTPDQVRDMSMGEIHSCITNHKPHHGYGTDVPSECGPQEPTVPHHGHHGSHHH